MVLHKDWFGQKACGDLVEEEWFGHPVFPYLTPRAVERNFDRFTINFYGRNFARKGRWVSIDRGEFERALCEEAKRRGAKFRLERVARIRRKGKTFLINDRIETKFLVGADGADSVVRSFLGQEIEKAFAIRGYVKGDRESPTLYVDRGIIEGGYAWIFPKRKLLNVGVVGRRVEEVKRGWRKFTRGMEVRDAKGSFVPCSLPCKTEFENAILVGDAAGQINPLSFAGINLSLLCGSLAAEAIASSRSYEGLWRKEVYRRLRIFHLKGKIFWGSLMKQKWAGHLLRWFF